MNPVLLYLFLLKGTVTSFSGLASLPVVRQDLVIKRGVLTDRQLNAAVAAGRTAPGPNGLWIVSAGYFADGVPGAIAGTFAVITPAFLILPMMHFAGARARTPRVRGAVQAVLLASAGLLISSSLALARDAVHGPLTLLIALVSFAALSFTRIDSAWVMLGAAIVGLGARLIG